MAKILVVDDEEAIVTLVKFILEKAGHDVDSAYNGAEALRKLGITPDSPGAALPDLMILDVMMPVVDGYTVAITVKNHERTGRLPLLVLTAKGDTRHLFEAIPSVAGFFQKPFEPKHLRDCVASALTRK
ncbi:MAG: response regulator [Elusimicrobia bacterium]|nr:response regulator [Elusimicrobiota bacterium]